MRHDSIRIHPAVEHTRPCPRCGGQLAAADWAIPGQWTVARYRCGCGFECWADLPFNLGVLSPCFIDLHDDRVFRPEGPDWYEAMTQAAWSHRGRRTVQFRKIGDVTGRRVHLVNALGSCWGDAIATIAKLNAIPDDGFELVVLTTENLGPHVPKRAAETWLLDAPHADAAFWNEELADVVKAEVSRFVECRVPVLFQLPKVTPAETAALSHVAPFDRSRWDDRLEEAPVVTFMWRDDRCWTGEWRGTRRFVERFGHVRGFGRAARLCRRWRARVDVRAQYSRVNRLARELRSAFPRLDFAVCGHGSYGRFPAWIADLRRASLDDDANLAWCARAARSHLVIGVLGSHMVLPSGHAGAVIDLIPADYLRNVLTDLLVTSDDVREALFLYRTLPRTIDAASVADVAVSLIVNYSCACSSLHGRDYAPLSRGRLEELATIQRERVRILRGAVRERVNHLVGP